MKIAVIGSGNVATWLINALSESKYKVSGIYSRNSKTSKILAKKYSILSFPSIKNIDADVIFICVNDDAIKEVANELKHSDAILLHTSGTVGIEALQRTNKSGVIWPLQSLSPSTEKDVEVPLFLSSSDEKTLLSIKKIAKVISDKVYVIEDKQRKKLHLAAVLTNNFINHLVAESKSFLEINGLKYEMLLPILRHTFFNLTNKPYNLTQTGPAVRGDKKTIATHKQLLKETSPELLKMYAAITENIIKKYNS